MLSVVSTFWYRTYCVIFCFFCSFNCRFITFIEINIQGCFERITIKKLNQGYSKKSNVNQKQSVNSYIPSPIRKKNEKEEDSECRA